MKKPDFPAAVEGRAANAAPPGFFSIPAALAAQNKI
jgi:hypothetical protein